MSVLDVVVHLLNFLAPALGVGAIAALLTKMLWRRQLEAVSWSSLALRSCVACAVVLLGGLLLLGRDGHMATYAAMVVASGVSIWWAAFIRAARKTQT